MVTILLLSRPMGANGALIINQLTPEIEKECITSLQMDLNDTSYWTQDMQMSFNYDKCHVLHLGRNNSRHPYFLTKQKDLVIKPAGRSYDLNFIPLQEVTEEKDLGVIVDEQLSFSTHIATKVNKANKMVGCIRHSFKHLTTRSFKLLFQSLVRPHLEYATAVWSPHLKKHQRLIENVQRRATKLLPQLRELDYSTRLERLQLPSLHYRRTREDMLFTYRVSTGLLNVDGNTHCDLCTATPSMYEPSLSKLHNTRGHSMKYQIHPSSGIRHHFLPTRSVPIWNKLSKTTIASPTLTGFKTNLASDVCMPNKYAHI